MNNLAGLSIHRFNGLLDTINDRLTSYRLMLYFLLALVGWAILGSFFDKVPYSGVEIVVSAAWLAAICWISNQVLSRWLDVPANKESWLISGLILALILSPPKNGKDFAVLAAAGLTAMASKYLITVWRGHIFNPAAAGALVAGEIFHHYPSWWVGTKFITPLVVIGGLLILRKMKRFSMVGLFLAIFILYLIFGTNTGANGHFIWLELISTQVLFFAVVMLTEPLTSPVVAGKYLPYAALVAVLYSVTSLRLSPEEALLIGNLFAFLIAPNRRYRLQFVQKIKQAEGIYSYIFAPAAKFNFQAGQYMEWTVAHSKTDSRGNRRYLTVSSSPTEPQIAFTIKQPQPSSSFKQRLSEFKTGDYILAGHLAGNFTLPKDKSQKLAFLAGGVGITPFRSIIKYLLDTAENRDVQLLYSVNNNQEIAFKGLWSQAAVVGLKTDYIIDEHLDEARLKALLPDFKQRAVYISGPYGFVQTAQKILLKLGAKPANIITDYFPGYG